MHVIDAAKTAAIEFEPIAVDALTQSDFEEMAFAILEAGVIARKTKGDLIAAVIELGPEAGGVEVEIFAKVKRKLAAYGALLDAAMVRLMVATAAIAAADTSGVKPNA